MYFEKQVLRIPGPVPIPPSVNLAMSKPMIGHRSPEMKELINRIQPGLKNVFGTKEDVIILAASGTAALETAAVNLCQAGDEVLVAVTGAFGERFADICDTFGFQTHRLEVNWGDAVEPGQVRDMLTKHRGIKAVFFTYCETSTGVLNPIKELAETVKAHSDALVIADGVSCIGGVEANLDHWDVDLYVTGSQKAMMLPPGLSFLAASEKAWKAIESNTAPRFYLDLKKYRKKLEDRSTPFTPAVSLLFGLEEILKLMHTEGLPNIFSRHRLMRDMTRAAFKALEIPLLAGDEHASPTVTAVRPEHADAEEIRSTLSKMFNLRVAGGPKHLKGKIFRIGHLGYCTPLDVLEYIAAAEVAFKQTGAAIELGNGVRAAQELLIQATEKETK